MIAAGGTDTGGAASDFVAGRYRRYSAYKDSEIEWLGKVPAHWQVRMLKHIGTLQAGAGFPDVEQGDTTQQIPFFKVGDMGAIGNSHEMLEWQHTVSQSTARRLRAHVFPPETIVFAKVGAALLLNRRRILVRPSCVDNNMMGFISRICNPKWAVYWLSGLDLGELANPGAVPSVNEGQMRETPVCVPPAPEQRAIATFLDRETAKIDALVAKKGRLIELLQEKRSALITRAVTKGLDPDVPMKDSGVEWLGKIPVYWLIARTWQVCEAVSGGTPSREVPQNWDGSIPWVSPKDMKRRLILDTEEKITELGLKESGLKLIHPPAVLVVVRGMILAHSFPVGLLTVPATINQDMKSLKLGRDIEPRFFAWLLDGVSQHVLFATVEKAGHGTRAVRMDQWRSLELPIPPVSEQTPISEHLDRETAKIDTLVAKVREAIERLREFRTALISAAVTGKIDVRHSAA